MTFRICQIKLLREIMKACGIKKEKCSVYLNQQVYSSHNLVIVVCMSQIGLVGQHSDGTWKTSHKGECFVVPKNFSFDSSVSAMFPANGAPCTETKLERPEGRTWRKNQHEGGGGTKWSPRWKHGAQLYKECRFRWSIWNCQWKTTKWGKEGGLGQTHLYILQSYCSLCSNL